MSSLKLDGMRLHAQCPAAVALIILGVARCGKRGLKQRLAHLPEESVADGPADGDLAASCSEPPRGSLRRRLDVREDHHALAEELPSAGREGDADEAALRRRGGVRQRLAEPPLPQGSGDAKLPLLRSLRRDWALGKLTSKQVQEYAWGATWQGAAGVGRLSRIGNEGRNPQNMHRALLTVFGRPPGSPDFHWAEIPTKRGTVSHPFLLPHEFFSRLYAERKSTWTTAIAGAVGACREFWHEMRKTEFAKRHPSLPQSSWDQTIPLGLHGDGGSFSKHDSLFVISWNSVMGTGVTKSKRFIFTCIRKSDMVLGNLDAIWKVFAWSCNTLLSGETPTVDHAGRPRAGGGGARWPMDGRALCANAEAIGIFISKSLNFYNGMGRFRCAGCAARRPP